MVSLGMELGEAIARSTLLPARVMDWRTHRYTSSGADADIAMFNMDHGPFRFEDIHGDCSTTDLLLRPAATIKSGQLVFRADSERES
jgi:dihydroorotase